jgi:hypothetical protein
MVESGGVGKSPFLKNDLMIKALPSQKTMLRPHDDRRKVRRACLNKGMPDEPEEKESQEINCP